MKKSPLVGIRFYSDGELLDLGGDTYRYQKME